MHGLGKLILTPRMADLKSDKNIIFKADPYCVFLLGDQRKVTTPCKSGGTNPSWETDVVTFDRTIEELLVVQIWDSDLLSKDDFLCEGCINILNFIQTGGKQSITIELFSKGELWGRLLLDIAFEPEQKIVHPPIGPSQTEQKQFIGVGKF